MTFTVFLNEQSEILKELLQLYYPSGARVIDLTYGAGKLWKQIRADKTLRSKYRVTACDSKPARGVRKKNLLTDDYSRLGRHDVAVFDPPYLVGRAAFDYAEASNKSWSASDLEKFTNNQTLELFNYRVERLTRKARSFLKPDGLLFVKIMDPRKDGTLIPHHINIANTLHETFKLIDLGVYIRMGATTWKIQGHLQNLHGFWLIFQLKAVSEQSKSMRRGVVSKDLCRSDQHRVEQGSTRRLAPATLRRGAQ